MQNRELFNQAKKYLLAGVNSPVRSFSYTGTEPLLFKKGKGSLAYDYQNREFIDYCLSFGALILGHARAEVVEVVKRQAEEGFCFGTTHESEVELSRIICQATPAIDKLRFTTSGTEAVMGAVRLSRGYTKRNKIIKFANSYHGHADYLLVKSGSGLATQQIPVSQGVPSDFLKHTSVIDYGDLETLEAIFRDHGEDIAAVLVEPVGGNYGVIPANQSFLKEARIISKKYGSLLIADEIITGFRFGFGTFLETLGIIPDLVCFGKIIGGGLPIGAYGAKSKIMDKLSPQGKVYQASTFAGNPMVMRSGVATLNILANSPDEYKRVNQLGEDLVNSLKEHLVLNGAPLAVNNFASMFSFKFTEKNIFRAFYRAMLKENIYFAPSEYEANFLSFSHSESDINKTIEAIKKALKCLVGQGVRNG